MFYMGCTESGLLTVCAPYQTEDKNNRIYNRMLSLSTKERWGGHMYIAKTKIKTLANEVCSVAGHVNLEHQSAPIPIPHSQLCWSVRHTVILPIRTHAL